jgi:alanine dehydrogenase
MLAEHGVEDACRRSEELAMGVNLYMGKCVHENVAKSLGIEYTRLESVLNQ